MMSEVKRYARMGELVQASPALLKLYPAMTVYVLGDDFDRVIAERDALQQRLNAADQRIDELATTQQRNAALIGLLKHFARCADVRQVGTLAMDAVAQLEKPIELGAKPGPDAPVCRGSAAIGTACGKCARCLSTPGEVKFKGMIETACGTFAIMIDEANAHYGWTFQRGANGMWVSGRKATEAEMNAARAHAKVLALFQPS